MLSDQEFNKIKKALDEGKLKLRFLTPEEYQEAEDTWRKRKQAAQSKG